MSGFDLNDIAYIKSVDESAIVTSGLAMYLDAGNKRSYPGYGTNIVDLSGNGKHGTFTSPIWSSSNGGIFQFNTTNRINTSLNLASGRCTLFAASRYTAGTHGRVITATGNNWLFGHHASGCVKWYSEGWVVQDGPNDNNWRIYGGIIDTIADIYTLYVNGAFYVSNANGSQGPANLCVDNDPYGETSNCEVGFIIAYNRCLTAAELLRNYNAMKGRYGLN
jgi:hypothetical protein